MLTQWYKGAEMSLCAFYKPPFKNSPMIFETIKQQAKNKVTVGDEFIIEDGHRTVTKISTQYVYMDNGRYYIKKHFNSWVRIDNAIKINQESSLRVKNDLVLLKKEAHIEYNKKYKKAPKDYHTTNSVHKFVIMALNINTDNKPPQFYFSPSLRADYYDLMSSYKSLHGIGYHPIAQGEYIVQDNKLILIGLKPYNDNPKLLSDKRKAFCMIKLMEECKYDLYTADSYDELISRGAYLYKLLSSSHKPASQPKQTSQAVPGRHWSGLNGDIAQDMLDQGLQNMLDDGNCPF